MEQGCWLEVAQEKFPSHPSTVIGCGSPVHCWLITLVECLVCVRLLTYILSGLHSVQGQYGHLSDRKTETWSTYDSAARGSKPAQADCEAPSHPTILLAFLQHFLGWGVISRAKF